VFQKGAVGDLQPLALLQLLPEMKRREDEQQIQGQIKQRVLPEGLPGGVVDFDIWLVPFSGSIIAFVHVYFLWTFA